MLGLNFDVKMGSVVYIATPCRYWWPLVLLPFSRENISSLSTVLTHIMNSRFTITASLRFERPRFGGRSAYRSNESKPDMEF